VPNNFHDSAFIFEFFEFILLNDFFFNFFDCNGGILPSASVNDSISTFGEFSVVLKLIEWNLVVLVEDAIFLHHVHEPLILIHYASSNFLFDEFSVAAGLL
jgi:hypothetical protein